MHEVLKTLPVIAEVKNALCGGTNRFREVYEMALALERAEWIRLSDIAARIGCDESKIPDSYLSALLRATSIGA